MREWFRSHCRPWMRENYGLLPFWTAGIMTSKLWPGFNEVDWVDTFLDMNDTIGVWELSSLIRMTTTSDQYELLLLQLFSFCLTGVSFQVRLGPWRFSKEERLGTKCMVMRECADDMPWSPDQQRPTVNEKIIWLVCWLGQTSWDKIYRWITFETVNSEQVIDCWEWSYWEWC